MGARKPAEVRRIEAFHLTILKWHAYPRRAADPPNLAKSHGQLASAAPGSLPA